MHKTSTLHITVGFHLDKHGLAGADDDHNRLKHDGQAVKRREPANALQRTAADVMVDGIALEQRHGNIDQGHDDIQNNDKAKVDIIRAKEGKHFLPHCQIKRLIVFLLLKNSHRLHLLSQQRLVLLGCLDIVDIPVDAGLAYQFLMSAHLGDLAV